MIPAAPPPYPAERFALTADRLGAVIGTRDDVLLFGAEAILALEATATSLAAPGRRALNIVTSPYGAWFGAWLRRGGTEVAELRPAVPGMPVTVDEVARALEAGPRPELVALVHGEAASGIVNPVAPIAELAHRHGALVVVDAVASVGGHPVLAEEWGADVVVIGPQKALDGPASLSAASVSAAAWETAARPTDGAASALSLADLRRDWLETGRGALPGTPDPASFWALDEALDAVEHEGIAARIDRHRDAARIARDALRAAGLRLWIDDERNASTLVTTFHVPATADAAALLARLQAADPGFSDGVGAIGGSVLRLNHTGRRATRDAVEASADALRHALG